MQEKALELSYIPSIYWNEQSSGFKLINGDVNLPENTNFFFVWTKDQLSEKELNICIERAFESIPPEKLISCQINLAFPTGDSSFYEVRTINGKIIPIIPMTKLLYVMELLGEHHKERIEYIM